MPDVNRIILGLRLGILFDSGEGEDSTFLVDDEDMAGVVVDILEADFITYSDDDLIEFIF